MSIIWARGEIIWFWKNPSFGKFWLYLFSTSPSHSESRNKLIEFRGNNHLDVKFDDRFKKHVDEMKHLVDYYDEYMSAHLINNNSQGKKHEDPKNSQIKLLDWVKNKTYVAMALTNYTIQVNFFLTHFKVIIQGQFDSENKVPWLPTSPLGRKTNNCDDLSVISMAESDITQPFKIIFINNKRMSYELNDSTWIQLCCLCWGMDHKSLQKCGLEVRIKLTSTPVKTDQAGPLTEWHSVAIQVVLYNQSQYGTPEHQYSYNSNAPHSQSPNCQYNSVG